MLDEPPRQLLRQCLDGSLLFGRQERAADRFDSCGEANMGCSTTSRCFYNQRRRHSTLDQISSAQFEKRANEKGGSMENRKEHGFPQPPQPYMFSIEEEKRTMEQHG
jgi:hypothetical protein